MMIKLREDVTWWHYACWRKQILAFGIKSGGLYLARCNWSGKVDYLEFPIHSDCVGLHIGTISHVLHDTIYIQVLPSADSGEFHIAPVGEFGDGFKLHVNPHWMNGRIKKFCWLNEQGTDLLIHNVVSFQRLQFNQSAVLINGPHDLGNALNVSSLCPVICWNGYLYQSGHRKLQVYDLVHGKRMPDRELVATLLCHSGSLFVFAMYNDMVGYMDMNGDTAMLHPLGNIQEDIIDMCFIDKEHVALVDRNAERVYNVRIYSITLKEQVCIGKITFETPVRLILPFGDRGRFAVLLPGAAILFLEISRYLNPCWLSVNEKPASR